MTQEIIHNLQELQEFSARIYASGKKIICLSGDLGAGKTEFARAFIGVAAAAKVNVTSPTYNIVQIYAAAEAAAEKIYHFDLYRLESAEELYEIGFEEALEGGICLIEWPEIAAEILQDYEIINLKIEIIDENTRRITTA